MLEMFLFVFNVLWELLVLKIASQKDFFPPSKKIEKTVIFLKATNSLQCSYQKGECCPFSFFLISFA